MADFLSYQEVWEKAVEYFNADLLAVDVWMNKYALRNYNNQFLEKDPDDMHRRLSKEFARIEKRYKDHPELDEDSIYNLLKKFKYIIPQGSIMSGLGNPFVFNSLSNCVVLPPVHDSYGGICYTDQQLVQLFKRRCGVGIDISNLRPEGMSVRNSALTTSGAISFMNRFSNTTKEVCQNGRRGALMICMHINHPDIEKFVLLKRDLSVCNYANISIKITDEFLYAVERDEEFVLRFPIDVSVENALLTKRIRARDLWEKISESNWLSAEPGLLFWDTQNQYSTSHYYPGCENVGANPCGEIVMQGGDTCRLLVVNLFSYVENPYTFSARFNFDLFSDHIRKATILGDDLVDLEIEYINRILNKIQQDPEPNYIKDVEYRTWLMLKNNAELGRRIGIGVTGLADCLIALGITYGSDESLEMIDKIFSCKMLNEFKQSIELAKTRGAFQLFDPNIDIKSKFIQGLSRIDEQLFDDMMKFGRRNISLSTMSPTGSVSILTQTSNGIEPLISLSVKRRRRITNLEKQFLNISKAEYVMDDNKDEWVFYEYVHPKYKFYQDLDVHNKIDHKIWEQSCYTNVHYKKRIEIQSVIQKYTTHSISSTVNLPSDITIQEISDLYLYAWKKGLKGITVFRFGSREAVIQDNNKNKDNILTKNGAIQELTKRPEVLPCDITEHVVNGVPCIFIVTKKNDRPFEIFAGYKKELSFSLNYLYAYVRKRKERSKNRYLLEVTTKDGVVRKFELNDILNPIQSFHTRLISTCLRYAIPIEKICDQLYKASPNNMFSFERTIGRVLKKYVKDNAESTIHCPNCGGSLIYVEGCVKCVSCDFSQCS